MKKIISVSFVLMVLSLVFLGFVDSSDNEINILVNKDYMITDVINDYTNETGYQVNIWEYSDEKEIYNLVKNNQFDLIIVNIKETEKLFNNNLLTKIEKSNILNYRNIKQNYVNDNDYYIPLLLKGDCLNGIMLTNDVNKKVSDLVEYLLRADVYAKMIQKNGYDNINWAADYYLND